MSCALIAGGITDGIPSRPGFGGREHTLHRCLLYYLLLSCSVVGVRTIRMWQTGAKISVAAGGTIKWQQVAIQTRGQWVSEGSYGANVNVLAGG